MNNNIILYTTHCPKCKTLEILLTKNNVVFSTEDDRDIIINIGQEHNITGAPILKVEEDYLDFNSAIKYVKGLK